MPIEAASAPSAFRFQPQPQPVHAFLSDLPDDIGGRSRPLLADGREADGRERHHAVCRHRLLVEVAAKSLRYKRKMVGVPASVLARPGLATRDARLSLGLG
jgi:hypothetical protein